jgi:hypothetical protein
MAKSTLKEILAIQQSQLDKWQLRLNKKYFNALKSEIELQNSKLTPDSDPYSVFRGTSMDNFISNTHI